MFFEESRDRRRCDKSPRRPAFPPAERGLVAVNVDVRVHVALRDANTHGTLLAKTRGMLPVADPADRTFKKTTFAGPFKYSSQKKFERGLMKLLNEIVKKDFPYFGACYGFGTVIKNAGGNVSKKQYSENAGPVTIKIRAEAADDKLMRGLPKSFRAFVGHKEACFRLPKGAVWLAESAQCPYQMVRIKQNIYAAQFHPELDACEFCVRVDVYKNYGYFDPKDAEKLKKKAMREKITTPMEILRRFTEFYGS